MGWRSLPITCTALATLTGSNHTGAPPSAASVHTSSIIAALRLPAHAVRGRADARGWVQWSVCRQ
jgi:hypothetical protein